MRKITHARPGWAAGAWRPRYKRSHLTVVPKLFCEAEDDLGREFNEARARRLMEAKHRRMKPVNSDCGT